MQEGYRRTVERIDKLLEMLRVLARHARVRADQGHMNRDVWVIVVRGLGVVKLRRREIVAHLRD